MLRGDKRPREEGFANLPSIPRLPCELQTFRAEHGCCRVIALKTCQGTATLQRPREHQRGRVAASVEGSGGPLPSLAKVAPHQPELGQRPHQAKRRLRFAHRREAPLQRRPEIVMLSLQTLLPGGLLRPEPVPIC